MRHETTPGNLPCELNHFVGRRRELDDVARLLERARMVTVTGVGGVGKSRLALRAAAGLRAGFADGVWLAELAAVRDPGLVDHAVADALGLTDHTARGPRAALGAFLARRELLLVLDCCEPQVEAAAELADAMLRRAPGLRVLATSRQPLGVAGEHIVALEPLSDAGEAVELFADRAAAVLPDFTVDAGNRAEVEELCRRLDGIPLALELAAGRLRALSVRQITGRLDDRFRLLTRRGGPGGPERHRALRTAIGWSHELCTPRERLLWARLSVFAGDFDLDAAEYVCAGGEVPAEAVVDLLADLVDKSVVLRREDAGVVRYLLLDTVREYGLGWLRELGEERRLRTRHRDWYLGFATWGEMEWFGARQEEISVGTERELANLRAALEFSLEVPEELRTGQYLAASLWFFWVGCGRLAEGRYWLERALAADHEPTGQRAKALWVCGYVSILQGDGTAALGMLYECREQALATGDATAVAYAVHRMGCGALLGDDLPRARALFEEALGHYRTLGELNSNVIMAEVELAMAVAFDGDLEGGIELCDHIREVCEDHGERWALAYALYTRAVIAWWQDDPVLAAELAAECVRINHTFRDMVGIVLGIELLALLRVPGDAREAAVLQGAAGGIWRLVGLPVFGSRHFGIPHQRCEELARAELGRPGYEGAYAEGLVLDLDAAVARALTGLPPTRPGPRQPRGPVPPADPLPAGAPLGRSAQD
ncbi:ATP-binding protein [Actinacidiphila glaucinigra]|uniref:Predicted ATPase n=1 Tax=Actinacidiphila glaucinigra TaxID=235986 RepID=A0A239ML31_9ACTN|nr:regulator [Actinacidiphila glaucinigra]SNT43401.1 Predicted ATPase [Actinacidiphila glaucinigra]